MPATSIAPFSVPTPAASGTDGALRLTHWGLIRAQGADAAKFLHSQLTQDFSLLGPTEARLAGYCSAKGRLLATFVGFKLAADDVLLACSADLLPATLKRLQMFVMRAACKLTDASADFELWGLAGPTAQGLALSNGLSDTPWAKATPTPADGPAAPVTTLVRLPVARTTADAPAIPRVLVCSPSGQTPAALTAAPALDAKTWAWLEVASGVGMVSQPVADAFVPQMINLESVGGVNFKKGCYPGQEVVARSQYRGTIKRRAFRLGTDGGPDHAALSVGQEVFHSSDAAQPCGTIFSVAPVPGAQGWEVLASLQISATTQGTLHAGSATGPTLHLLNLPYALLEDV